MAINRVGSKGIEDCSVATADFADGTVSNDKITDGTITNAKLTNSSFTLSGTSVSLGGSTSLATGLDWQAVKTASFTAVKGQGYFVDTTSSEITVTLPTSPSIGDTVAIKDYAGTFGTNKLIIDAGSEKIQGSAVNSWLETNRAALTLTYVDSTKGWLYVEQSNVGDLQNLAFISATGGTVSTDGDYKVHKFTGDGTFVVSCAGAGPSVYTDVDYLVVAGGGAGGGVVGPGGGGGAGGFRESAGGCSPHTASPLAASCGITVTATTYPVTVGGGGARQTDSIYEPQAHAAGQKGSDSVFSTITSAGGGGGGGTGGSSTTNTGGSGSGDRPTTASNAGNTPPVSPPQGNPGGGAGPQLPDNGSGGGGGAASAGGDGYADSPIPSPWGIYPTSYFAHGGAGGQGATTSISGTSTTYAGGGSGGARSGNNTFQTYGAPTNGGGGMGAWSPNNPSHPWCNASYRAQSGQANTGGGGGSAHRRDNPPNGYNDGGAGGKGIVILRYKYQ